MRFKSSSGLFLFTSKKERIVRKGPAPPEQAKITSVQNQPSQSQPAFARILNELSTLYGFAHELKLMSQNLRGDMIGTGASTGQVPMDAPDAPDILTEKISHSLKEIRRYLESVRVDLEALHNELP